MNKRTRQCTCNLSPVGAQTELSAIFSQDSQKSGDPTESVAKLTPYLTVHLLSVILTEIYRVVVMMEAVVSTSLIVYVLIV